MSARLRPPVVAALAALLFAIAPILSVVIACAIASWAGCELNEADVHHCVICGVDIGEPLYVMYVMGWCALLTLPLGSAFFAASILWLVVDSGMRLAAKVKGTAVKKSQASDSHSRPAERLAQFVLECQHFRQQIASTPEFRNVRLFFTRRKGGRVYLHGHVPSKEVHDRLLEAYERLVHSNDSGCYDGVEYPGRPPERDCDTAETRLA